MLGGYKLAFRRNLAHTGTAAILPQHDRAGGHWILPRWERLLANSVLLQTKHFNETKHSRIRAAPQPIDFQCMKSDGERAFFSYEIASVRGDGTNTRAGEAKAHTCEIQTLLRHLPVGDSEEPEVQQSKCWADLGKIHESFRGVEARATYLKQCRNVGVIPWVDESIWLIQPRLTHHGPDNIPDQLHIR